MNGLCFCFHTGSQDLPKNSLECKNLKSASLNSDSVTEIINKELNLGYLYGPFSEIPFRHYRINPIGIAESNYSKKKCLIVDMSAPHNDEENLSMNTLIDKSEFSLCYVTMDDAIRLIKLCGKGASLIKSNITDAFKIMPILYKLWPYHGIKWDDKYYFFKRLVFGSRSSPKIFDALSSTVCWIAEKKYKIPNVLHLLDDFLVVVPPFDDAHKVMEGFLGIFRTLGIPLSEKKTEGPCTELEYLGIILDSLNMESLFTARED